jgi:hypothetical protein
MLIAFGHRRKVGKDTAVRFMINHLRWNYPAYTIQKATFAEALKDSCYALFGQYGLQPTEYYEQNPDEKEKVIPAIGMSARDIWIKYGNDCRAIVPTIWIDHVLDTPKADIIIMTDLRYPNEADAILARGGALVKITRDVVKYDDEADTALANWNGWTHYLANQGSLEDFHASVINFTEDIVSDKFAELI